MTSQNKIICQLASGTYGNVFLCDFKGQRRVVKKIPLNNFTDQAMMELKILQYVNHPRVIKLIDFHESISECNIIMEYACNGSLRNLIMSYQQQHWKLSHRDLIDMFLDIAFGIKYLHAHKIIHRDLKPENVLMVEGYRLKIADFGVSKIVDDLSPNNHTSIGTLCYMSPEVYLHQPYDSSCDIWALGLIFYEMAMMKYPFSKADKARIMNQHLEFNPPLIDCQRRKYEPYVQNLVDMMLQRSPKDRATIHFICNYQPIKKSMMYPQLAHEDQKFR